MRTAEGENADSGAAEVQSAVFAFLQDAKRYGSSARVRRIDTHCAVVFLVGPDVYKVKRAVRFPFLDFSTLEKRHAACLAELDVNKANAPDLYLGVLPITRRDGALHLGGAGEVVEWTVHLRRFDETMTLDHLSAKGPLGAPLVDRLARRIVAAHARAPNRDHLGATARLRAILGETVAELRERSDILSPQDTEYFASTLIAAFELIELLLLQRSAAGQVRRCHGDLHLGNIALIAGEPVLFDAIEFDDEIATCDVLYDLAFVLMDLWERGLQADANLLLNRYLALCDDEFRQIEGLAALPLFLALRAAIRAKIFACLAHGDPSHSEHRSQAVAYFMAACRFLQPAPPRLVAIGGLSGSGKTVLSAALAPRLGLAPGALHLRSDIERKQLFAMEETTRLGADAYQPSVSEAVYNRLRALAQMAIRAGQSAIIDATHHASNDRDAAEILAASLGVSFVGIWLDAPATVLASRVLQRVDDASDATAAVVAAQLEAGTGAIRWVRLDADQPLEKLVAQAGQFVFGASAG